MLWLLLLVPFYIAFAAWAGMRTKEFAYSRKGLDFSLYGDAQALGFVTFLALPVMAPLMIGLWLSKFEWESGPSRVERKRAKEIAAANHAKELARINAETLALKEREAGIERMN